MKWTESLLKPNCSHILLLKVNTFWSYIASTFILILIYFLFYHRPFLGPRSLPLQKGRKEKKRPSLTSFDNISYPSPLQFRTSMHPSPPQTILLITLAAPFDYYYTVFILLALPCISFFLLVIFHLLRFFL